MNPSPNDDDGFMAEGSPFDGIDTTALSGVRRLQSVEETRALGAPVDPVLQRFCSLASRLLSAPLCMISLVDAEHTTCIANFGITAGVDPAPFATSESTFCQLVVETKREVALNDVQKDGRFARTTFVTNLGIQAYLGVPINSRDGQTLGAFCVLDTKTREWSAADAAALRDLAMAAEAQLAMRSAVTVAENAVFETRQVIDGSDDAFVRLTPSGVITDWNPAAEELFGWKRLEVLDKRLADVIVPERDLQRFYESLAVKGPDLLADQQRFEAPALHRDGTELLVEVTMNRIEDGRLGSFAFMRNVTEQKAAEQQLARSAGLINAILENTDAIICAKDLDGRYLFVNRRFEVTHRLEARAVIGKTDRELFCESEAARTQEHDRLALSLRETFTSRQSITTPEGKRTFVSTTFPLHDANGDVYGICIVAIDDTERARSELMLEESRQRLDAIVARLNDFVFTVRVDGINAVRTIYMTPDASGIFGGQLDPDEEFVGAVTQHLHPYDENTFNAFRAQAAAGEPAECEVRVIGMDGVVRWVWVRQQPRWLEGKLFLDGIASDVTERHRLMEQASSALSALDESEKRFQLAFDNSPLGICMTHLRGDGTGRFFVVNAAFARITGRTKAELAGMSAASITHPDDLHLHAIELARLSTGEIETAHHEKRYIRPDGTVVWVDLQTSAISDDDGPAYLVTVVADITQRRMAERARLLAERRLSEMAEDLSVRNAELEDANQLKLDLIGMLSHDIGTPLTVIQGRAEMALDDDSVQGMLRKSLESILRSAQSLDDIRREALTMTAIDNGKLNADREDIVVSDAITEVLEMAGANHVFVSNVAGAKVLANPVHLQQILGNFITNAAKYGGGATSIDVRRSGFCIEIRVRDEGHGVPEEFRPMLFERFSRSDDQVRKAHGTGLGLYIVRGLAEANGGEVWYEQNLPTGSTFVVRLEAGK